MDVREALVGTNKKFECQVIGFPPPTIRWFKDNVEITHDPRYHFSHTHADGVVSMHIKVIKLSDAGLYQCRAENCEGYAITAAHLQVKAHKANLSDKNSQTESVKMTTVKEVGVHKADETVVVSSRRRPLIMTPSMEEAEEGLHQKESAPKFVETPETIVCKEDETIKVFSKCQGSPRPVVTWFRDGKLLKNDSSCRLYDKKDEYFLEIRRCSILDSGEYTCTATNSQGAIFCSFNVHVEGKRISVHDLSAVEEEHSTDVQSDHDKETHFLSRMYVIRDFYEPSKTISFNYGDVVEVLDTQLEDKWLVRKKDDTLQVAYMPRSYLATSLGDGKSSSPLDTTTDSPKNSKQKKSNLRKSSSAMRRSIDLEDSSSGEEADSDNTKETVNPVYVAVADYESPELKVCEGQFLEVLDQTNPHMWLVKTKPTKVNPSRVGWMPASYLEQKEGGGLVDRRSTREVFREDIIQITNKPAEAKVKRRYALGELVEAEKDYINELSDLIEQAEAEDPAKFRNQASVAGELKELVEFHKNLFLPELTSCLDCPSEVANAFMNWHEWFESYKDYCGHRIVTDVADSKYDKARESKLKYFTKPISQLKRYESLLKDFVRYTTRAGEDCAPLEQVLNMLMSVVKAIDDQLILNNIYGAPEDVKAFGNVLRHDAVTMWENEPVEGKGKGRHLFLFPSQLVMAKPIKAGSTDEFEYKNKCELPKLMMYTYPNKLADNDRRFELFHMPKGGVIEHYIVQCKNEYSRDAWVRDISDAMIATGITDFKLSEAEHKDLVKRRQSQVANSTPQRKPPVESQQLKQSEDSPQTETDAYVTASTDVSSYYTAAESDADSNLRSAETLPAEKRQTGVEENLAEPQVLKPQFSKPLKTNVVAAKGGSAKLSVIVEGDPQPSITWYKDGKELKKGKKVSLAQNGNEYSALLEGLSWDTAGKYKVTAVNHHGKETTEGTLTITTKLSEVTADDEEMPEQVKGIKPKFIQPLTADVNGEDNCIRLECKISADPEPEVKWLHNHKSLPTQSDKYSFLFVDDETHTLLVKEPGVLDAGKYTVLATNKLGTEESSVEVNAGEIQKQETEVQTKTNDENLDSTKQKDTVPFDLEDQTEKTSGPGDVEDESQHQVALTDTIPSKDKQISGDKEQKSDNSATGKDQVTPSEAESNLESARSIPDISKSEQPESGVATEDSEPVAELSHAPLNNQLAEEDGDMLEPTELSELEMDSEQVTKSDTGKGAANKDSTDSGKPAGDNAADNVKSEDKLLGANQRSSIDVEEDERNAIESSMNERNPDIVQEFVVVEEIGEIENNIDHPPSKKLVATRSLDQVESEILEVGTSAVEKVSRVENGEIPFSNDKLNKHPEGKSLPNSHVPNGGEADVAEKEFSTALPTPIYGKPSAHPGTQPDTFILSWEVPDHFKNAEGITYSVEMCESGNDWRRIRSGLKESGVELPSSAKGVRYRVIVENSEGEESLPSLSLMVRTGKWRDSDSSSLLSKLEKKYMPVADPDSIPSPHSPRSLTPSLYSRGNEIRNSSPSSNYSLSSVGGTTPLSSLSPHTDRHSYVSSSSNTGETNKSRREYSSCLIPNYSSYKEHPLYQEVDDYISTTIDRYGSTSFLQPSPRRHGSVDRVGSADALPSYDMSMVSPTIMKISVLTNSVKLKWPPSIRDIHSTYVVEGRAPSKSLVWNTHASRILATTVVIKGLQLDAYDYEFRVRTSNVAGLGEPTRSVSTSELREKGWEEMRIERDSVDGERMKLQSGYTNIDSDNFYWKNLNKLDLTVKKNLSELLKAYADGYPIEPRFDVKDPNVQFAVEGRQARLMLHIYTHADSDIKWYFKGEKVMMDDRYSSNLYPSGLCVLEFPNMSWADAGEYKIKVQNRWGVSFKCLELKVSDPPTFLETPKKSYQLNRLDSLRVSCRADGIPFPKVTFYRDWQLIPSASRCVVRQEGPDTHSLTINGVLVKDSGTYQIVAENEAGRIHCSFSILVEEGTKSDGIVSVKRYLLEDYYYVLEELVREEASSVHRVIEKSTGIAMFARIYNNPDPAIRRHAHQQMMVMQSAAHENVIKLLNVIENNQQVVLMYEVVPTTWIEELFSSGGWTESFVAQCVKDLLTLARYLHSAYVSLANLQLENVYFDKSDSQIKVDVWKAGFLLNSTSLRAKYTGTPSMFCAPEVISGEVNLTSDAWNIGVITYILLGGVPTVNKDGGISVDMTSLANVSADAKDFISKLLQREYSERKSVEEALRHQWLKSASLENHGPHLDISNIKTFLCKEQNKPIVPVTDNHKNETEVIKAKSRTVEEEAWLVDWFAKYKHDHNTYLVPIRELDLPIRLREYRKHFQQDIVDEYDDHWKARTLRTRELPGTSSEEVMKVKLSRDDLIALANQGLALIEKQASEATGFTPHSKTGMVFRKKLETSALKVGDTVELECEVEGDKDEANAFWYRNDELIMGDIEKNTVLVSDRFKFSYAKDGKLSMIVRSTVPTDAGVYKCSIRTKTDATISTKARLLVGDVPGIPGRPVAARTWDTCVYLVWSEPIHDGNNSIQRFKVDCKPQGGDRWIVCHITQCCSAVIEGLSPSTIYRFRVSAVNDFGFSSYSWASPEIRTLKEGSGEMTYTPDMRHSVRLSLTPPVDGAAAPAAAGMAMEVDIVSSMKGRHNSACESMEVITPKLEKAGNLYRITDEIVHSHANGSLYKCERRDTKQEYLAATRGHTAATSKELSILQRLHHNHLQNLVDLYEQPTQFTLIFQGLSSETVLHRLARKVTYAERFVTDVMTQLCNAVEYLHHRNITHGVVHPCNLVMSSLYGHRVVLTNFSQARSDETQDPISSIYTEFLAPEVVMNEGISKAVDIWGLGLSALILLSGKSPFHGTTDEETVSNIQYLRFRISSVHPNSSQNAHKFIYSCLRRVPGNRPDAEGVVNHPWLDVGHQLHQQSDQISFPAVEFLNLVHRLDKLKEEMLKVESVTW